MGEVLAFAGPVDGEEFYGAARVAMFRVFVEWLGHQPGGKSLIADLSLVNEALEEEDQGDVRLACEAACRLAKIAEWGPMAYEMVLLFGTLHEIWKGECGACRQCSWLGRVPR